MSIIYNESTDMYDIWLYEEHTHVILDFETYNEAFEYYNQYLKEGKCTTSA